MCWLVPCVLAGTLYLRLRLELLHDIQEVVVDLRLVPELELDLVQIGQGVPDPKPLELLLLLLSLG